MKKSISQDICIELHKGKMKLLINKEELVQAYPDHIRNGAFKVRNPYKYFLNAFVFDNLNHLFLSKPVGMMIIYLFSHGFINNDPCYDERTLSRAIISNQDLIIFS